MTETLQHVLSYVAGLGPVGYAVFVLLYAACCVAFFPVSPLTFGAGAAYGAVKGFALVWAGATLGACLSFLIGRHWLRFWVEKRLAGYPLFVAIDAAVSTQGRKVVFLTRLTPIFPFSTLNYAYGLTRVKFGDYALASCLGMVPGTALFVYLGAATRAAVGAETRTKAEWAFFAVGLLATIAAVTVVAREAKRALREHVKLEP